MNRACQAVALAVEFAVVLATFAATAGGMEKPTVAVVTVSGVEAYTQTLAGIREQFPEASVWDARDEARVRANLNVKPPDVAIAVGSDAVSVLERVSPVQLTLVSSAISGRDADRPGGSPSRFRAEITVDLPAEILLAKVKRTFPDRSRIGVIWGPMQSESQMKLFEKAARENGLTVVGVNCGDPKELVEVFLKLKSRADLVWCPPNAQLYNSATVRPLLMASLTNRLPIIGFSEQLVQAGALFGGAADFVDVGRQAAGLAVRAAQKEPVPLRTGARKFRFLYNQRVARLLGVKAAGAEDAGSDVFVIR
jgi:ABC-type uncharacterized transport system substrate-binding protein